MNSRRVLIACCPAILTAVTAVTAQEKPPLRVVPEVDLVRYSGQWYEIARLPNPFQERCAANVMATYRLRDDGRITVINRCRTQNGEQIEAEGIARLAGEGQPNSVLKVRFAPAFLSFLPWVWGDYQIMALSPDYAHVLVGDPARKYLWILARSPSLEDATYDELVEEARGQGFDVSRLQKTKQAAP
jgi:apolipoprotein D and lipocalin family protein